MENTPTLTTSEEQRAPWNDDSQNYVTRDVTVSVTYTRTIPMEIPIVDGEEDTSHIEDELIEYNMMPVNGNTDWFVDNFEFEVE